MSHINLGNAGESLAQNYLLANGYQILKTNYRYRNGEIDIVASKNDRLVITEVKTRSTDKFGEPYLAVSKAKQQQIIKVANHYIENQNQEWDVRFDVISIIKNEQESRIKHIIDAFYPLV